MLHFPKYNDNSRCTVYLRPDQFLHEWQTNSKRTALHMATNYTAYVGAVIIAGRPRKGSKGPIYIWVQFHCVSFG